MTALREYCLHLITQHVMEEGHECAGACVHDDVGLGWLAGDLFNQIIKATRINTPAFVRILNQIDFHGIQRWKACKRVIDGVSVETTYENAFVRQILSQ
jgi:hypothetical protein